MTILRSIDTLNKALAQSRANTYTIGSCLVSIRDHQKLYSSYGYSSVYQCVYEKGWGMTRGQMDKYMCAFSLFKELGYTKAQADIVSKATDLRSLCIGLFELKDIGQKITSPTKFLELCDSIKERKKSQGVMSATDTFSIRMNSPQEIQRLDTILHSFGMVKNDNGVRVNLNDAMLRLMDFLEDSDTSGMVRSHMERMSDDVVLVS